MHRGREFGIGDVALFREQLGGLGDGAGSKRSRMGLTDKALMIRRKINSQMTPPIQAISGKPPGAAGIIEQLIEGVAGGRCRPRRHGGAVGSDLLAARDLGGEAVEEMSAICLALASISRPPSWAILPPTWALTA